MRPKSPDVHTARTRSVIGSPSTESSLTGARSMLVEVINMVGDIGEICRMNRGAVGRLLALRGIVRGIDIGQSEGAEGVDLHDGHSARHCGVSVIGRDAREAVASQGLHAGFVK